MDWDQEIENDRLKGMIIVYQEHIDVLEKETKELKDKIVFLKILICSFKKLFVNS